MIDSLTFEHSSTTRVRLLREWGTDCRFSFIPIILLHTSVA